jgi:hypothetical protein
MLSSDFFGFSLSMFPKAKDVITMNKKLNATEKILNLSIETSNLVSQQEDF